MANVLFAVFGSLGDLHPHIAVALEMKKRGHAVSFAADNYYREKLETLGFRHFPLRPHLDPEDKALAVELMDAKKGTEKILRKLLFPVLRESYEDLATAARNCDVMIASEVAFAAPLVSEKFGIKWISTALSPGGLFSAYDPFVPPNMQWFGNLRFLGAGFHQVLRTQVLDRMIASWGEPVRELRRELGLRDDVEPVLRDKYSPLLNLALFTKVLGEPQPDWHQPTVQCGAAFYDGANDLNQTQPELLEFMRSNNGDAPVIFTLGSAAVWDARDFFKDSAAAAIELKRRAVLILGENEPPKNLPDTIRVFDYAPYSAVFPLAAAVVHQGGVGTTSQVLRAGAPQLVVPFSHDQPDNAARVVRYGCARSIPRDDYTAKTAARELSKLLANVEYKRRALDARAVMERENGVQSACNEIEKVLAK